MKVMLMRKADEATERGEMPGEELLQAMADYNQRLLNAGVLVSGEGLRPSSEGVRLQFVNGDPLLVDGPFSETKELLAGFTVLQVNSFDEAVDWARQWPKMDANGNVTLELRRYYELSDFTQGDAIAAHEHLGEQLARLPVDTATHLSFAGDCREALEFYVSVLGGEIQAMMTHGETPAAGEVAADWQDKIIHAQLNLGGRLIMAADAPPPHYQRPQGFSVALQYDEVDRGRQVYDELSRGGQVHMPFAETFWARGFAMFADRYGIPWMINCGMKE